MKQQLASFAANATPKQNSAAIQTHEEHTTNGTPRSAPPSKDKKQADALPPKDPLHMNMSEYIMRRGAKHAGIVSLFCR